MVENDDGQWAAGRQDVRTNPNTGRTTASSATATGTAGQGPDSVDRRGASYNRNTDSGVAWNNGNVYADHDGNVYQHNDNGWQQHTSSGWQPVQPNTQSTGNYLNSQRQARDYSNDRMGGTEGGWQGRSMEGGWQGRSMEGGWQGRDMGGRSFGGGGFGGFRGGGFRR
ncbi:hypothetical protein D3C72_1438600 [compost metagenome]